MVLWPSWTKHPEVMESQVTVWKSSKVVFQDCGCHDLKWKCIFISQTWWLVKTYWGCLVFFRITDQRFEKVPYFVFGDFNFRLDSKQVIEVSVSVLNLTNKQFKASYVAYLCRSVCCCTIKKYVIKDHQTDKNSVPVFICICEAVIS